MRWLRDWRTGSVILASVLVAYLGVLVVSGIQDRRAAIGAARTATNAAQATAERASRRITQLLTQISALQQDAEANGQQIAQLLLEVALLEKQVRGLGGEPVVTSSSGASGSARPSQQPTPSPSRVPSPRPSPSRTPTPTPTPSPSCLRIGPVCV